MQIVLLRIGIDKGAGGIYGPLFHDGSFEYIPLPDRFHRKGVDERTYGNFMGKKGRFLVDYFPERMKGKISDTSIHFDPEFDTFTYGDPTQGAKRGLRKLERGDLLLFYCGLKGWDCDAEAGLYLTGYFEVETCGLGKDYTRAELDKLFAANFHVRHRVVFDDQKDRLILVKGTENSRLLSRAHKISTIGRDKNGTALHILSPEMCRVFGDFGGRKSIQRSAPRWIAAENVKATAKFVKSVI